MTKIEKAIHREDLNQRKPPMLCAWLASVATISLIIVTQILPQGGGPYLRGIGVSVLLLASIFIFGPFYMGQGHYELGRIYVDPAFQNRGIGQQAVKQMFEALPDVDKWTVGTPGWAVRNQHFYEKMGVVKVRETEVDPDLGWAGVEYKKHA